MARSAVLIGRTAADLVMNFLTLSVMLLVGVAVGFRPSEPAYDLALAFALVLAFSYVFSWISAFIGLSVRDPGDRPVGRVHMGLPAHVRLRGVRPTSSMPSVLRAFAGVNPVTQAVDAARALSIGQGTRARQPWEPSPGSPGCCSCSCRSRCEPSGGRKRRGHSLPLRDARQLAANRLRQELQLAAELRH